MLLRRASAATVLLLFSSSIAEAAMSQPNSHAHYSADRKRLLVMISDWPACCDLAPEFVLKDGRSIILRDFFCKSGCYDAQTLEPIWQVDWFAFEWELRTSADFTY